MYLFAVPVAALLLLASALTANAQPTVTGSSGQWSHKSVVTISGSGFGSKSTAAPAVWDDASGQNILDKWDGAWPNNNPVYETTYRTPLRGIGLPHNRIARYIAGGHGEALGADAGYNVLVFKHRSVTSFPAYTYVSWYQRADDKWVFGDPAVSDNNFKTFAVSAAPSPYTTPNWYLAYNPPTPSSTTSPASYIFSYEETGPTLRFPDARGHDHWWGEAVNPMSGVWTKVEMEIKYTSENDGYVKLWENGVLRVDYFGHTDSMPGPLRTEAIGGYARLHGEPENWRYFSDIYLDYSRARVILGNAATFAASTVREVQIPTVWSDSSISVSVNLGAFKDGEPAYLYVVDENGSVNSEGLRITAMPGGPIPDLTAPEVSLDGLATGATVTGQVLLAATASDNDAVASVQFKVDGINIGIPDTIAPYSILWNSATAVDGAHLITAVARDTTGNERETQVVSISSSNPGSRMRGLVAAFGFEEGSGTIADASGNHHTGIAAGGTTWQTGQDGSAIKFDGTGLITIADSDMLDLTTGMTVEARVNPSALSGWRTVIMKETTAGLVYTLYANDNAPNPAVTINTGGPDQSTPGTVSLVPNVWTHLAATYDGAVLRLFVNGDEVGSRAVPGSLVKTRRPLRIGGNGIWGEYFEGLIDDVRVYNRALSASEIRIDMATPVVPLQPPPPPPTETTVFGPQTYTSIGLPILDKKTFDVTDATGEYSLRITNDGVMAAVVAVNGRIVLRPRDFVATGGGGNDNDSFEEEWERLRRGESAGAGPVPFIEVPVRVRRGANQLWLAFWGREGTSLTAQIVRTMLPPACTITSPMNGSAVREGDAITVRATATDNVGVAAVRFQSSDGTLDSTDASVPYKASFVVPLGATTVTFTVTARDAAGNAAACSSTVDVLPIAPPTVAITSHSAASTLTEGATVPVLAAAGGGAPIVGVDFAVNGETLWSDSRAAWAFEFTVPAGVGWVSLRAAAVDRLGRSATSEEIVVPVVPDPLTTVAGRLVDKSGRPLAGVEVAADVNGLSAEIFDFAAPLTEMPDVTERVASRTTVLSAANLRNPGFVFGDDPFRFGSGSHAVRLSGYFRATHTGVYTFGLGVNEGGRLVIGGTTVVNLPAGTGAFQQGSGRIWLPEGLVPIQIVTFDNGNPEIQLSYIRPGDTLRLVPQSLLTPAHSPFRAFSDQNGVFAIRDVPTALGAIGASATFTPPGRAPIAGAAKPAKPTAEGTTELGAIRLR